jgi:hypothetical protein
MRHEEQRYIDKRGNAMRRMEMPGRRWADLTPSSPHLDEVPEEEDHYQDLGLSFERLYL